MTDPGLTDLDAFVAVARARSFRTAAALRSVSPSTLSEAVRRLEGRLGVRLLNRTTRSVTPTEAGRGLMERLGPALGEIAAALDAVGRADEGPTGTLRLNVPTIVARHILPPIAARFLSAYPGIRLEVGSDDNLIDVLAAGYDAGIRYEEHLERDMIAVPFGPRRQRFVMAASADYIARHGAPTQPADLLHHACIRHRFPSGRVAPWEFERDGQTTRITPSGRLVSTVVDMSVAAAVAGLGLIWTFEEFVAPALAAGRLVPVMVDWWQTFSGPRLYYPSRAHMPAPLRAFIDFTRQAPDEALIDPGLNVGQPDHRPDAG